MQKHSDRSVKAPALTIESSDAELAGGLAAGLRGHGLRVLARNERVDEGVQIVRVIDEPDANALAAEFAAQSSLIVLMNSAQEGLITTSIAQGAAAVSIKPLPLLSLIAGIRVAAHRAQELSSARARSDRLASAIAMDQRVSTVVGIIMERFHLTLSEAHERLRRHARSQRSKLPQLADEILANLEAANQVLRTIASTPLHKSIDPGAGSSE